MPGHHKNHYDGSFKKITVTGHYKNHYDWSYSIHLHVTRVILVIEETFKIFES